MNVAISQEMLTEIEEYRVSRGFPTLDAALDCLLKAGLKVNPARPGACQGTVWMTIESQPVFGVRILYRGEISAFDTDQHRLRKRALMRDIERLVDGEMYSIEHAAKQLGCGPDQIVAALSSLVEIRFLGLRQGTQDLSETDAMDLLRRMHDEIAS
jgi:hypothetical protein